MQARVYMEGLLRMQYATLINELRNDQLLGSGDKYPKNI
jgi:hypothetical protein